MNLVCRLLIRNFEAEADGVEPDTLVRAVVDATRQEDLLTNV